jgi:1,4-alpha-glucan branching enzyme
MASSDSQAITHPKLYKIRGAQYCKKNQTTTFRLYAPNAKNVWVILTGYGREEHKLKMEKTDANLWEVVTREAQPGRTYLYLVDDYHGKHMLRTDPVSFSVLYIPEVGQVQSVVHDQTAHRWADQDWMGRRAQTDPLRSPLSIYEIQIKSWKSGAYQPLKFRQLAPELVAYCLKMEFTHVEMYSLFDHAYKEERGYQVANYFAPYRDSGTCDDLKYLVDQLHQHGIGVIIDWIPTHFHHHHQSNSFSASLHEYDGTNLYASHVSPWGTLYFDFNKEETCRLLSASALYFLDELHVDGIRFDAVSQMIRRESKDISAAIMFLRQLNQTIHTCYPGVLSIVEETESYPNLINSMGFDLKWNIGWSHDTRNLLRTPYAERPGHWQHKVLDMLNSARWGEDKMILTLSHDDTDSGGNKGDNVLLRYVAHARNDMERFSDLRNFFAWQTLAPSRGHMVHMGDEVVQPESWYHRFRRDLSSMDWSLVNSTSLHGRIQECIRDLNELYRYHPQFWQDGEQDFSMIYEHGPNLVVAYHRGIYANRRIAVIHNFSNRGYKSYDIPLPTWDPNVARIRATVEIFNTDHAKYGGSGSFQNQPVEVVHHDWGTKLFRLSIPPLATIVLEETLA